MLTNTQNTSVHCGTTTRTGYLKDANNSLPAILGKDVDAIVCFHGTRDPCYQSTEIMIKKCHDTQDFFIYNLPTVPGGVLGCGQIWLGFVDSSEHYHQSCKLHNKQFI